MRIRRPRVGTLLLLIVLVPISGLVGVAISSGQHRWAERSTAREVSAEAAHMDALLAARTAVIGESVASMALTIAAERTVTPEDLTDLSGIDFARRLVDARVEVDADPTLHDELSLSEQVRRVLAARGGVDAGTVSSTDVAFRFDQLADAVNELWLEARVRMDVAIAAGSIPGSIRESVDLLRATYDAFLAGGERIRLANLLAGGDQSAVRELIEVEARLDTALSSITAVRSFRSDDASVRFDAVIDQLIADGLAATPSSLDTTAYTAAFADGARWLDGITQLVGAASADLGAVASRGATDASDAFWRIAVTAWLTSIAGIVGAALLGRSMRAAAAGDAELSSSA